MKLTAVTHVIFDMDGLLLDTVRIYNSMMERVVIKQGYRFTLNLRSKLLGRNRRDCAEIIVDHCDGSLTVDECFHELNKSHAVMLSNCSLLPGAERLIRHLHAHKIPMAIGTSSARKSVALKMTGHEELFSAFHHITCGLDDPMVLNGKPFPDIFLVAAARFEPVADATRTLVFEDAPSGVMAAKAAGMQVVMVPDKQVVSEDHMNEATVCLNTLLEFRPEMFGLPRFV